MANSVFVQNLADSTTIQKGAGTATATPGGVLHVNTTQAGTAADTNETDLWSYTMPANTLSANGKALRITAFGTNAATATTKTIRLYFGGTLIGSVTGTLNNEAWRAVGTVVRTDAAAEISNARLESGGSTAFGHAFVGLTTDTTAAIIIKVTGQNGTANANDIVFRGAIVEALN